MTKKAIKLTTVERAYLHDLLQDQINNHEKDENIVFLIDKIMYKIEEKEEIEE